MSDKPKKIDHFSFDATSVVLVTQAAHVTSFKCKIQGLPKPQHRCFATTKGEGTKVRMINVSSQHSMSFAAAFQEALKQAPDGLFSMHRKPIKMTVRCFFPRPKVHCICECKSTSLVLSNTAPTCVVKVPDLDNLLKLLLDALQGVCHTNDCQVVHIDAAKLWDHTQKVWHENQSKDGCTIIEMAEIDESVVDPNCTCHACKQARHNKWTKQIIK